jgi:hypothetical protein
VSSKGNLFAVPRFLKSEKTKQKTINLKGTAVSFKDNYT